MFYVKQYDKYDRLSTKEYSSLDKACKAYRQAKAESALYVKMYTKKIGYYGVMTYVFYEYRQPASIAQK